jgi:hypothetical protein
MAIRAIRAIPYSEGAAEGNSGTADSTTKAGGELILFC